jgi:hypothetical protein
MTLNRGLWENGELREAFSRLIRLNEIDVVAIEMVQSYGTTVGRSTFTTVLFVGGISQIARDYKEDNRIKNGVRKPDLKYYGRPTIKAQVGGRTDSQIRSSLRMRYGEAKKGEKLEGVKKDIWSALALASALTENPKLKEW